MLTELPPVLCLMGPTASGKTALALALHAHLPVELVSVDAAQVYRGMDIGTAKPGPVEQAQAPHRLIDIRDPSEPYSAADFCLDAVREIHAIHAVGRLPLLVGGTMFYFRALEQGLSDLPSANPEVRARITDAAARLGWPALHARLAGVDPASAARIKPHDAQRIQRALEIIEISGQAVAAAGRERGSSAGFQFMKLALFPEDRAALHVRIAQRFHGMLAAGLIEETELLQRRGDLTRELPSMRAVGYRQVLEYLSGNIGYQEMVERGIIATRQLAKRQLTWLRADTGLLRLDPAHPALLQTALEYFSDRLHL
jgi:tRNA dimethylallyltransferase